MLEEQQTTLGVLSDMAQAAKAQKKTMAVRGGGEAGRQAARGPTPPLGCRPPAAEAPPAVHACGPGRARRGAPSRARPRRPIAQGP